MRAFPPGPAKWVVLGAAFIVAIFPSPAAPVPSTSAPKAATVDSGADDTSFDNVELVDSSLRGKIALLRVGSEPSANNLLSVFLGVKNKTPHTLTVEMETIYKDEEGKALNSGSWVAVTMKPYEEKEYRSTSISEQFDPNAMEAHFLIRIRRATSH